MTAVFHILSQPCKPDPYNKKARPLRAGPCAHPTDQVSVPRIFNVNNNKHTSNLCLCSSKGYAKSQRDRTALMHPVGHGHQLAGVHEPLFNADKTNAD
jgi:hypothetical protein